AGCSHVVMEVSSHALDQRRTAGITFDSAVFTNLTQDHLDYHRDFSSYGRAKGRLFQQLGSGACAILNADDPASRVYQSGCRAEVVRYAIRSPADCSARDVQLSWDGGRFRVESRDDRCDIATPLLGAHNVYNCLAAVAVGCRM